MNGFNIAWACLCGGGGGGGSWGGGDGGGSSKVTGVHFYLDLPHPLTVPFL